MVRSRIILFLLVCTASALYCAGRHEAVKPDDQKGFEIFDQKCSLCHDLKRVFTLERDEKAWRETVTAMCQKKDSDCENEIEIIVRYHVERQQKAQKLFEEKCSSCHKRKSIQSPPEVEKSPDEWRVTIRRMMGKTKEVISDEEIDTLVYYHIRAHSMMTLGKLEAQSRRLGLGSTNLFGRKCSTCHSLDKALYTLRDKESWQKTIQNMAKKKGSSIREQDISELVNFHVERQQKEQEIFLKDCTQCHLPHLSSGIGKPHNQWRNTAKQMMDRAGRKISEEELDIITRYHISYESTIARLSIRKCTRCHGRKRVITKTGLPVAWEQLIMEMSRKEGSHITSDDIEKLIQYHVAKQEIEQEIFEKDCSACHEPGETLKEQKSRYEWKEIIRSMMARTGRMITDQEVDILIDFHIRRER